MIVVFRQRARVTNDRFWARALRPLEDAPETCPRPELVLGGENFGAGFRMPGTGVLYGRFFSTQVCIAARMTSALTCPPYVAAKRESVT